MSTRKWPRRFFVAGLVLIVAGLVDPLEGSPVIVAGTGLVALAAGLEHSRHRRLAYGGFALAALGVAVMWVISAFGGFGGGTGRSLWWGLVLIPYPLGWLISLTCAVLIHRERIHP